MKTFKTVESPKIQAVMEAIQNDNVAGSKFEGFATIDDGEVEAIEDFKRFDDCSIVLDISGYDSESLEMFLDDGIRMVNELIAFRASSEANSAAQIFRAQVDEQIWFFIGNEDEIVAKLSTLLPGEIG